MVPDLGLDLAPALAPTALVEVVVLHLVVVGGRCVVCREAVPRLGQVVAIRLQAEDGPAPVLLIVQVPWILTVSMRAALGAQVADLLP